MRFELACIRGVETECQVVLEGSLVTVGGKAASFSVPDWELQTDLEGDISLESAGLGWKLTNNSNTVIIYDSNIELFPGESIRRRVSTLLVVHPELPAINIDYAGSMQSPTASKSNNSKQISSVLQRCLLALCLVGIILLLVVNWPTEGSIQLQLLQPESGELNVLQALRSKMELNEDAELELIVGSSLDSGMSYNESSGLLNCSEMLSEPFAFEATVNTKYANYSAVITILPKVIQQPKNYKEILSLGVLDDIKRSFEDGLLISVEIPAFIQNNKSSNNIIFEVIGELPSGAVVDARRGLFTWSPERDQFGRQYEINISVKDENELHQPLHSQFKIKLLEPEALTEATEREPALYIIWVLPEKLGENSWIPFASLAAISNRVCVTNAHQINELCKLRSKGYKIRLGDVTEPTHEINELYVHDYFLKSDISYSQDHPDRYCFELGLVETKEPLAAYSDVISSEEFKGLVDIVEDEAVYAEFYFASIDEVFWEDNKEPLRPRFNVPELTTARAILENPADIEELPRFGHLTIAKRPLGYCLGAPLYWREKVVGIFTDRSSLASTDKRDEISTGQLLEKDVNFTATIGLSASLGPKLEWPWIKADDDYVKTHLPEAAD